jgi:hypothetical protein
MTNLFQFVFTLPNLDAELIIVTVYGENTEQACNHVIDIDLPLQEDTVEYLKSKITSVYMFTDEEETTDSNRKETWQRTCKRSGMERRQDN